ncbi:hypothetical protein MNBD_ACTINO02-188, partial [hydrothermal vent metagenome]
RYEEQGEALGRTARLVVVHETFTFLLGRLRYRGSGYADSRTTGAHELASAAGIQA